MGIRFDTSETFFRPASSRPVVPENEGNIPLRGQDRVGQTGGRGGEINENVHVP